MVPVICSTRWCHLHGPAALLACVEGCPRCPAPPFLAAPFSACCSCSRPGFRQLQVSKCTHPRPHVMRTCLCTSLRRVGLWGGGVGYLREGFRTDGGRGRMPKSSSPSPRQRGESCVPTFLQRTRRLSEHGAQRENEGLHASACVVQVWKVLRGKTLRRPLMIEPLPQLEWGLP